MATTNLGTSAVDYGSHPSDTSPLNAASQSRTVYRTGTMEDHYESNPELSGGLQRSLSGRSTEIGQPSRSNTLKKKSSIRRSGSRKSLPGRTLRAEGAHGTEGLERNSIFFTPIPTSGSPTEILANRFQAWRKILKDLVTYFREIQQSYEHRAKALSKVSNIINTLSAPSNFMGQGGLNDANRILGDYHRQSMAEANKAQDIEKDVINHLTILRSDLNAKIKEIKSLSGDFKNSVDKEKDLTRKAIQALESSLDAADHNPNAATGKDDPFIIRLAVDRQVERQIDEENYLHRAYLNLEGSGRELESIVVGEIQKAYNALAGILKRESDDATTAVQALRTGPIVMPKDAEWKNFVAHDQHFVNPDLPLRNVNEIHYPGKNAPAAAEVRAGMLERKSKYLKSYTPGWYVLSPTHLHEFKSADHIYTQQPVMSLFLADQKLGSKSQPGSSSHKFMLKGKQTSGVHRSHAWVFRAESYDTMLAWFDDIKTLTETKSGEERNAFVRKHARSVSGGSVSEGSVLDEDEADEIPFSSSQNVAGTQVTEPVAQRPQRPTPGGRFPSDFNANQYLRQPDGRPLSPSSGSSIGDAEPTLGRGGDEIAPANAVLPGPSLVHMQHQQQSAYKQPALFGEDRSVQPEQQDFQQRHQQEQPQLDGAKNAALSTPTPLALTASTGTLPSSTATPVTVTSLAGDKEVTLTPAEAIAANQEHQPMQRHNTDYASWMAPVAGSAALGAGAVGAEEYWRQRRQDAENLETEQQRQMDAGTGVALAAAGVPTSTMQRQTSAGNAVAAAADLDPAPTPLEERPSVLSPGIERDDVDLGLAAALATTAAVHGANDSPKSTTFTGSEYIGSNVVSGAHPIRAANLEKENRPVATMVRPAMMSVPTAAFVKEAPAAPEEESAPVSSNPVATLPRPVIMSVPSVASVDNEPVNPVATMIRPVAVTSNSVVSTTDELTPTQEKPDSNGVIAHTAYDTDPVDGHVNAKATGHIFPQILRHNTDVSVSDLHVPGQWKN